jgi:hypothetical protein|tara:strand:+ start:386 stop:559 length:174 start_codon:yes stop_codon:yes gene_type:complete
MNENYYNNTHQWVFDTDGNFLHSKRTNYNPNILREGYFFSDVKTDEEEYLYRKENKL